MTGDPFAYFRKARRREYLRQHEKLRRADRKAEGARRIDVTLNEDALGDYERVRQWVEGLNRIGIERGVFNRPLGPDGRVTVPPFRLSDTEIIKAALRLASGALEREKQGKGK